MRLNVSNQLEIARKKLLDTSARNRLINYKESKTVGAEIHSGELTDQVFNLLVTSGKTLRFAGQPDTVEGGNAEDRVPRSVVVDAEDDILSCRETVSRLAKKLLKTYRNQRTLMEETGVDTLFLALGRLKWTDPKIQKGERSSPLLLIPVTLEQRAGTGQFFLTWDGQDVLQNLSLAAYFKDQFGVELPTFEINEDIQPSAAFQQLNGLVEAKNWSVVADEISLAFFSSAKYLMYADLDQARWASSLADHPDLHILLNPDPDVVYGNVPDCLPAGSTLDAMRPVETCTEVVECDGSQLLAIMQAAQGKTMVIEGPPGTGKSQTITNLLADCVARGKTVLFVAEKQAALNVVARNLERVGLRSLCLELHSHSTNKALFYRSIVSTLGDTPANANPPFPYSELQRVRDDLNNYADVVNKSVQDFGLTPREIMGEILQLGTDTTTGKRLPNSESDCSREHLALRREAARSVDLWVKQNGLPREHPFCFVTKYLDPIECKRMVLETNILLESLVELVDAARGAANLIKVPEPEDFEQVSRLCRALEAIGERPGLTGLQLNTAQHVDGYQIQELLHNGCRWAELHAEWSSVLTPESESAELDQLKREWHSLLESPFRVVNPRFYSCRGKLNGLARNGFAGDSQRTSGLSAAIELRDLTRSVTAGKGLLQQIFLGAECMVHDPWHDRRAAWEWLQKSRDAVAQALLPSGFFDQPLELDLEAVRASLQALRAALESYAQAKAGLEALGASLPQTSIAQIQSLLEVATAHSGSVGAWVVLQDLESRISHLGVPSLVPLIRDGYPADEIVARSYFEQALKNAYEDPVLRSFSLPTHGMLLDRFRSLDQQLLQVNRERIRAKHFNGLPQGHGGTGGIGLLQREATKQRRHQPIRKTMQLAWPAIQKIKPIFMMSPVSVAMYLPQDGPRFDVVIFDEASQVRPEEAIGAIARASQAIVVGDTKQMPPTSFFERMTQEGDSEEDEVEEATAGLESILDVVSTRIPKNSPCRKDLRWHYRSRHQSLITPSNGLFYDWRLFIVPNPCPPDKEIGLVYNHLPNAHYDRGNSRTNRAEAQAVADAILFNLKHRPNESLMAVAFSAAQQQAIQDELDLRLGPEPELLAAYQAQHPTEPIDVKNLENVQGDERDVVLISIGYGKNEQGYFAQSFGPLNQEGGGRRLNVLITRARKRCEVFTNLEPEDVKPEGNAGRYALRTFLSYARSGYMDVPNATGRDPMSVFEEQVIDALQREGYHCEPQVGVAGFFIDIGVRHPDEPHRYCLGIECDGAQYHRSLTARDRDRLRQSVLESRGWMIHRIWSTDWFGDPKGCLERTVAAIRQACDVTDRTEPTPQAIIQIEAVEAEDLPANGSDSSNAPRALRFVPYEQVTVAFSVAWDYDWLQWKAEFVMEAMAAIVSRESPICLSEVIRRLRESAGGGRAGSRIAPLLRGYASQISVQGHLFDGDWFMPSSGRAQPRDRSHLDASYRKPELIHDVEIMAAMGHILRAEVVMPREKLSKEALRLLGIGRVSRDALQRLDELIEQSIAKGFLEQTSAGIKLH